MNRRRRVRARKRDTTRRGHGDLPGRVRDAVRGAAVRLRGRATAGAGAGRRPGRRRSRAAPPPPTASCCSPPASPCGGRARSGPAWAAGALALGARFLLAQVVAVAAPGGSPPRTRARARWATSFFALSALHALHVLGGLVAIALLLRGGRLPRRARAGCASRRSTGISSPWSGWSSTSRCACCE